MILGFDPGKDKCGVAVMSPEGKIETHQVIPSREVIDYLQSLCRQYKINLLVMGNQTTCKTWQKQLKEEFSSEIPIQLANEYNSTNEARERYWKMYPPRGLMRLVPLGMRLPPRPVDDIVAIILIERYLASECSNGRLS